MNTLASGAPPSARSTASTCPSRPVPASTSAGSRPLMRHVLFPVGPVHSEGLPAGIRSVCMASEEVPDSHVHEVAVGKPPDRIVSAPREPPDRSLDLDVVAHV